MAARQVWSEQVVPNVRNDRYRDHWLNSLRDDVFSAIGSLPIKAVTQADILRVLAPIWTEKPETARNLRRRLRAVMDCARAAGHVEGVNPVEGVEKGLPKQRTRVHLTAPPYADVGSHRVPLSGATVAVLERLRGLSDGLIFPSTKLGVPIRDKRQRVALQTVGAEVTVHGFRSTFRDWAEEMTGFPHEVKEAALAHALRNRVEATYRRLTCLRSAGR